MDDADLPLPTLEEVLICNSTTTAEEVLLYLYVMIFQEREREALIIISCTMLYRLIFCGKEQSVILERRESSAWSMPRSCPIRFVMKLWGH
jgi:hypothetical protein